MDSIVPPKPNPKKAFEFDLRIEGITRSHAEYILSLITRVVDLVDGTMAGGFVEVEQEASDVEEKS